MHADILHVIYWLRAEGVPRLALSLMDTARATSGIRSSVAVLDDTEQQLLPDFESRAELHWLGWQRGGFARLGYRTLRLLQATRPRGVICYSLGVHVPVAAASAAMRIPCVVHVGNAPSDEPTARLKLRVQMKVGEPLVAAHAACSAYVQQKTINAYGLRPTSVVPIPNGIDLAMLAALRRLSASANIQRTASTPFTVGMVASLEPHKDQATLLQAIAELHRRGVSIRLLLVGDGTRRATLHRLAADLAITNLIEWTGAVTDVHAQLRRMHVFAYSVTDQEGLGIALVEALAAGLPVVASRVGACCEVLENGRWGILVNPQSPHELADGILKARELDPVPLDNLAKYDIRNTWDRYWELLGRPGEHGGMRRNHCSSSPWSAGASA